MAGPLKGDDLSERLLKFAARIIRLAARLPGSLAGRHVCGQILRSGSSAGANYEEARGAESKSDFIHKIGIVLKELRETTYWLKLISESGLLKPEEVQNDITEGEELSRIIAKSIMTARGISKTDKGNQRSSI